MYCSFFGHKSCSPESYDCILETIEKLIVFEGVDGFYVGNKGGFDRLVHLALEKLKRKYPHIKTFLVMDTVEPPNPRKMNMEEREYLQYIKKFEMLVPDGIETVPKCLAISYRNKWMIKECDIAVVYYLYPGTNTKKFVDMLLSAGKTVINIAEINSICETE